MVILDKNFKVKKGKDLLIITLTFHQCLLQLVISWIYSVFLQDYNTDDDLCRICMTLHIAGRMFDMIQRGALSTRHVAMFVLDEADEMLSEGFKDKIYDIFRSLNNEVQVNIAFVF